MTRILPAKPEDSSELIELWHAGWHDAHAHLVPKEISAYRSFVHFRTWFMECGDAFHVARNENELLGFVSINGPEVVKLYVGSAARGTGLAATLLSYAEHELFRHGVTAAELYCTAGNSRAERFYKREGWTLSRTFMDALWLPKGAGGEYLVETLCYREKLSDRLSPD
jgi:GNAT superfamily N-acetyltransferase